jgi:hypothetical protein
MTRAIFSAAVLFLLLSAAAVPAQVRPVEAAPAEAPEQGVPANLPESIQAEYQGGIYGYSQKEQGQIKFDVINERLIFLGEDGKEKFSIPYDAIILVYPSQKKVTSGTGRAVSMIPLPGASIGGMFLKKKKNYLVIQYQDQDVDVKGAANFLIDTGDELFKAIHAVGTKAEMQRRGDAYIRKKTF